jgi:hypothetical protein
MFTYKEISTNLNVVPLAVVEGRHAASTAVSLSGAALEKIFGPNGFLANGRLELAQTRPCSRERKK